MNNFRSLIDVLNVVTEDNDQLSLPLPNPDRKDVEDDLGVVEGADQGVEISMLINGLSNFQRRYGPKYKQIIVKSSSEEYGEYSSLTVYGIRSENDQEYEIRLKNEERYRQAEINAETARRERAAKRTANKAKK